MGVTSNIRFFTLKVLFLPDFQEVSPQKRHEIGQNLALPNPYHKFDVLFEYIL